MSDEQKGEWGKRNGQWKIKNGEWGMSIGEWTLGSGERAKGERGMENEQKGKWKMKNRKWGMSKWEKNGKWAKLMKREWPKGTGRKENEQLKSDKEGEQRHRSRRIDKLPRMFPPSLLELPNHNTKALSKL